ncbi:2-hydroxyacylsphingosine 1-beta-galactosyltransferase [Hippocampus zosterae]|uniref:2-hydroxyacylsphingosine 1-beta-galactosyltransferase n=1 Tax=Hippocampus zosterae TaxID=109293 RepID=UPI00223DA2AB|nr:2-hydroxyacylsphingosine 1-beta-galactosyltransferase [Hippocampus zosterae]XP_051940936.1 2-hydroxyacylsphingosine 1-beta-galactosyltransferase [Hippocampus zosterae]
MLLPSILLFLVGLLMWHPSASWAAKIIVVPPTLFESHMYIFKTLATSLHEEGHETHFLVSEGREVLPSPHYELQRYTGVFNSSTAESFLQSKVGNIFSGRLTFLELFDILEHYSQNCDAIVGNSEVMARLKQAKFDLLLVDPNEMCGFVLAHILGLKYAVVSTGLWYPTEVGAPTPLSYVPVFNSLLTDRMSLFQRITNTAVYLIENFGVHFILIPKYDRIMRKHGIKPRVAMTDLVRGSQMWMLCTDLALEFPRPTLPHVVYIGGILTRPANPLPQDFEVWVNDTAETGFVVVSFGAGVKYLSHDIAHKLAGALARLPQRVIWRFSGAPPSNIGNNTKLVDWMPQNDLLGHPNIRAFLSHGGLNSIFEAMYHGVPVVGVPLFGDHYDTMTRVTAKGMGIMLHWKSMSEDDLYNALATVINDTRYRQRAAILSTIHKDQPDHPVTRAVYWINYTLRHNGTDHLRSAVYDISLYQYFLLDVIFVIGSALVILGVALRHLGRLLRAKCGDKSQVGSVSREDGNMVNGHCYCLSNGKHQGNGSLKNEKKVN